MKRLDYPCRVAGAVAVVSHDRRRPVGASDLADLIDAYTSLRGGTVACRVSAGDWARAAAIDGNVAAMTDSDDASWLVGVGAPYAEGPLCRAPAQELDGHFALIRYEANADKVSVLSDPFGMQALYIASRDGRTYVSTSAIALARYLGVEPDPLGMKLFLRAGYQFGPVTHWRGVERLGPAVALSFTDGAPRRAEYWSPAVDERVRRMGLRQTVDHCTEVARESVRTRLSGEPCLWADLTGGFDSRMTAGLLASVGIPFVANTNGDDRHEDVRLGCEVARAGGYRWRRFELPLGMAIDRSLTAAALGWGDGALELVQLAAVLWRHELRGRQCRTLVAGSGGEHVSARPWVQELVRAGRSRRVDMERLLRTRYLLPVDMSMLRRDPTAEVEDYCRRQLLERAAPYADEPNTTQIDVMYAYKSTGHFGAYRSASEAELRTEMPFYYRDLFTATFSAHYRWRNWHRLQRGIIARLDPAVAGVPTTLGGPAEPLRPTNVHRFAPYLADVAAAAARKLLGRERPSASPTAAEEASRRYGDLVRRLRAGGVFDPTAMISGDLYEPRALEGLLARAGRPGSRAWKELARIATLECALRAGAAVDESVSA